ncbi:MAG: pyridoxal-phosphate dependent enzyme [Thaumarchaeota archaeon]|nr:pyridoxal-phosphate dependent enzyme [Nitrososphaerota archaeon]
MPSFECANCPKKFESNALDARCVRCGSALFLSSAGTTNPSRAEVESLPPGVWRFRGFLPEVADNHIVSIGEGGTPMLAARRLGEEMGFQHLLLKDETRNPTGSFIDRGSTVLMSLAKGRGVKRISCVTTGNLGASLAAYSAKAGVETEIRILPNTDHGKLYQMIAYGARVEILSRTPHKVRPEADAISISAANPFILEGEKTTGLEMIHDLGWKQPDAIVVPVGTGGHLAMIWRSLLQLHRGGLIEIPSCKLIGVQLQASAPIVEGLQASRRMASDEKPLTELEESEPIFKRAAVESIRESGGYGIEISAREAIQGTSLLARTEGIFAEPASASVVASLKLIKDGGLLDPSDTIVCVITGSGLKDTKTIKILSRTAKHVVTREDLIIKPVQMGRTKLKILRALSDQPCFGYGIWKALSKERSITTASVYQHLSELEGIALIRRSGVVRAKGRERILYEITRKGAEFLKITRSREGRFVVD